ncbi:retrotransposon hot spot (RHS) protein [Trypanosoma conorhini]|uniref:Retrotransposon hot spot (RHS) protein n=1 Tax=Trypanosoma conorhini TaxID=83891 RepID=A0A422MRK5_9TRYP|nr:retrotransposon hot spot (RHS) protein [Trypanosoma conorhini]RNE95820.1 retrotransposon hot spot (RHS) protein [Trypanosoma conorhini]
MPRGNEEGTGQRSAERPRIERGSEEVEQTNDEVTRAAELQTQRQQKWTLTSTVKDVLLEGVDITEQMTLNDFIRKYVDPDFVPEGRNAMMEVFARRPERYVTDPEVREDILNSQAYQLLEDARKLAVQGVSSLAQWKEFPQKETVTLLAKGKLDAALAAAEKAESATRIQAVGMLPVPNGFYDSVLNAKCSHVLEFHEGEGRYRRVRMEVRAGQAPQELWEYRQDDLTFLPVEDAGQFVPPRPRLVILTSEQKWPYSLREEPLADCYVTREVHRVWRIVERDLNEWFTAREGELQGPMRRVLIGTPGIGKSMNVGSYLLYQMLRYGDSQLHVVVYSFGRNSAYVFDRATKKVTGYKGAGNV